LLTFHASGIFVVATEYVPPGGCLREDIVINSQGYVLIAAAAIAISSRGARGRHNVDLQLLLQYLHLRHQQMYSQAGFLESSMQVQLCKESCRKILNSR
jgi:hypothetical protein